MYEDIRENLKRIYDEIACGNDRGEKITLLGATKFVPVEAVNAAIETGLENVGENHAQEFRDKLPFYLPVKKHFIGTLQLNKLKYVVGKADVIDSVSSATLASAINERAEKLGVIQSVMLEINGGDEESKTGIPLSQAKDLYNAIINLKNLKLTGVMAMLPVSDDDGFLAAAAQKVRAFYDEIRAQTPTVRTLSEGMSGDYKIAVKNGSNQIRIGTAIFGRRY